MASWQARLLSLYFRAWVKRRPYDNEAELVRFARRRFTPPTWLRPPVPGYAVIEPVNESGVQGEWLSVRDQTARHTIYYLHGGGYIFGSAEMYREFNARLAHAAHARVFALDYRLAPEHRFPAAVEDAVAGYRWLLAQGVPPESLLIAGESAGGGLTLATLVKLRAEGLALPGAAVCFSPWTDLACTGASLIANEATDAMFYADSIKRIAPIYLGQTPATEPLASPLYADLTGLPALLLFVSRSEVLLDDTLRLAQAARDAGVKVDLQVWDDLLHVWPIFTALLPEARAANALIPPFMRTHLAG